MSKKRFGMGLSFLLMVILLSQCVLSVFAHQTNPDAAMSNDSRSEELSSCIDTDEQKCYTFIEEFDTSSELVSLRDENTKHFLLPDGSFQAVVSGDAVHRKNADGIWENIDNTLIEKNGRLETSDGRVSFSREVQKDDTIFTLRENGAMISFVAQVVASPDKPIINNPEYGRSGESALEKAFEEVRLDSGISFRNVWENAILEYQLHSNRIKENIILTSPTDQNTYSFIVELEGLYAIEEDGVILFCDAVSDEIRYSVSKPFMYDAEEAFSDDVSYLLEKQEEGKYLLTLVASSEWIKDTDRVFPITIDPSLQYCGQIRDAYASSVYPTTCYGDAAVLWVSGVEESYYSFATPHFPAGINITSATVQIPFYYDVVNNNYLTIGIYQNIGYWYEHSITWNKKPTRNTTPLDSVDVYANGASESNPGMASFSVTSAVQSWITDGHNYGFTLLREGGFNSSVKLIAKEKNDLTAKLYINYTGTHFAEGVYAVRKSGTSLYLKESRPTTMSGIVQYSYSTAPTGISNLENLFKISYRPSTNDYVIRSMIDNAVIVRPALNYMTALSVKGPENDSDVSSDWTWNIQYSNGNYYIKHTSNGTTYYLCSASSGSGDSVSLVTNSGTSGTLWAFSQYSGTGFDSVQLGAPVDGMIVGEYHNFDAYVRSTRIGYNGPPTYSLTAENGTDATTLASVNSAGTVTANDVGNVILKIKAYNYYGITKPTWSFPIQIAPSYEGTFFFRNVQSDSYMQINNNSSINTEGAFFEVHPFSGASRQQWEFVYLGNQTYKIVSVASAKVATAPTSSGKNITQTTYTGSAQQIWKIQETVEGYLKFSPTSNPTLFIALADGIGGYTGRNVKLRGNLSDHKDEWYLIEINHIYGSKEHRQLDQGQWSTINCHGYAMFRDDKPFIVDYDANGDGNVNILDYWYVNAWVYIENVSSLNTTTYQQFSEYLKEDFETWLTEEGYEYQYESSFTNNGENAPLLYNQYRVVLRGGVHIINNQRAKDYHFWYQEFDGSWSNKHGGLEEEELDYGTTPYTTNTPGWNIGSYVYFYDGTIWVYVITVAE